MSEHDQAPDKADRHDLEEVLQTALLAGMRVQMSGGYTARVCATMERIATALGADKVEPAVSSVNVGLTVHRDGWSRTAFRRTPHVGVNFSELTALSNLSGAAKGMTLAEIQSKLDEITKAERFYPPALILPMLGVSCGAFAAIFGADAAGIALATVAGAAGAWIRHQLVSRHYYPFVFALAAAFVSVSIVAAGRGLTHTLTPVQAACILYLVPGVPLLNGTADLMTAHYLNGVVRLTMSTIIVLASSIGLIMALLLWGVA